MMQINKFQVHISTLEIGSMLTLEKIISQTTDKGSGDFINDILQVKYISNGNEEEAKLWIRHFLDECEIENNILMMTWISSLTDDEGMIHFPDSLEIIGFNSGSKKVILRPLD